MDKKITISELSQLLSTNVSLINKKGWEDFLRLFFAQISEGLQAEGNVKIKGLGTFKVVTVDARKSKDVNTGANTIIPAHNKITFTPDSALAETLNKPYAHFEATYVLAPDGEVDAPEAEDEEDELIKIEEEPKAEPEQIAEEPMAEPEQIAEEPKAEPEQIAEEPKAEPEQIAEEPKAEPEQIAEEPKAEPVVFQTTVSSGTEQEEPEQIENVPGEEPEEREDSDPNADEDENIDTTPAETKRYAATVKRHDLPTDNEDEKDEDEKNNQSKKLCITAILILGLLIVIGVIVNMLYPKIFSDIRSKITDREPAKTEIKIDPVDLEEQKAIEDEMIANMAETNAEATNALVDSIEKAESESTKDNAEPEKVAKQNVKGTTRFKDDFVNYMKSKHPEMDITDQGDAIEEKLGQASRLTLVSLRHYGAKDFWIYIYLYNKDVIKNPNNIKAGTKIKVPDLDRKNFVNPESEHSLLTAKEVKHKFLK